MSQAEELQALRGQVAAMQAQLAAIEVHASQESTAGGGGRSKGGGRSAARAQQADDPANQTPASRKERQRRGRSEERETGGQGSGERGKGGAKKGLRVGFEDPGRERTPTRAQAGPREFSLAQVFAGSKPHPAKFWTDKIRRAVDGTRWATFTTKGVDGASRQPCWLHWMQPTTKLPCQHGKNCRFSHDIDAGFDEAARARIVDAIAAEDDL